MKNPFKRIRNFCVVCVKLFKSRRIRQMIDEDWCIRKEGRAGYHTRKAKEIAASCGEDLYVGYPSQFLGEIHLGDNCNFNGMRVLGGGK